MPAVALLGVALIGVALIAVPAAAQTGAGTSPAAPSGGYAGTANGNAFRLTIAGQNDQAITFGSGNVAIDSTPKAHADGHGALLGTQAFGGTSADSPAAGTTVARGLLADPPDRNTNPPDPNGGCGQLSLPPTVPALGLTTACSGSRASTANGLPSASAEGDSVYDLSLSASELLGQGAPLQQLGTAVQTLVDSLVSKIPQQGGDLQTLLDQLITGPGTQVFAAQIGQSISSTQATADTVTSSSTSTGARLCLGKVLPGGDTEPDHGLDSDHCLLTITLGTAGATASCNRATHTATPEVDTAIAKVELLKSALSQLYAIPVLGTVLSQAFGADGTLTINQQGQVVDLSPLAVITPSAGTTSKTATGASASAASFEVVLLPGQVPGQGGGAKTDLLTLALSEAQAAANCPGPAPAAVQSATAQQQPAAPPPASKPKTLAFTGDSPWRPVLGAFLAVLALGGLELLRRSRRRPKPDVEP